MFAVSLLRTSCTCTASLSPCNWSQWRRMWTTTTRFSSSDVYKHDHFLHDCHLRIDDFETAQQVIKHFRPAERDLLLQAIQAKQKINSDGGGEAEYSDAPSWQQTKQLFIINTIPFVGFGVLDNMVMILAGEYIDQYLGSLLCISTMAAAAFGNIISDLAGVGLAHYVEKFVSYVGFKHPVLTSEQLESKKARSTVNAARAFGLTVGCLFGMFPLLFFDSDKQREESTKKGQKMAGDY